jgi:LPS-assembly protein
MTPRRRALRAAVLTRAPAKALKRALLMGVALAAAWPVLAFAQQTDQPTPQPTFQSPLGHDEHGQLLNNLTGAKQAGASRAPAPTHTDGLLPGELYLEADELTRDDKNGITTAEGHVEVRYQDQTLRADRLVYQEPPPPPPGQQRTHDKDAPAQGVIRAYGHVQIIKDDGTVEFADELTIDDKMQAAVAIAFSTQMKDPHSNQEVKISSDTAVRRSEDLQELNRAIYTPCAICIGETPKDPTWSISADRIVRDEVHHVIYYRHAHVHVLGIPILYLPVFWHADPSADRESGFLAPTLGYNKRRGFTYQQPYLYVISPSADLTVSPQFNSNANPFISMRYREAFDNGILDIRAGFTHDFDLTSDGVRFGDDTFRSFILARGAFQITDDWVAGFTAERVSDTLLFDKYDIGRVYEARGPYVADDHRLISQVYADRQDADSYFSIAAFDIQGIRVGDNNRTFPVVAPIIDGHYEDPNDVFGGRLRFTASEVTLTRDQSPDVLTIEAPGMNSTRVSAGVDWNRVFTSESGLRVSPFINVRADDYDISDILVQLGQTTPTSLATFNKTEARLVGVAGADFSYPIYKRIGDATVVLEPLAQIALSPKAQQIVIGKNPTTGLPIFFNEDSVAFEFDETTLFQADKFPGYDLYEDGDRLNLAGRVSVLWDDGRRASLLIGRSFRAEPNNVFPQGSGLNDTASDWIIAGDAAPIKGLSFFGRARIDGETYKIHRLEAGVDVNYKWGSGYVRYLSDDEGIDGTPIKNVDFGGDLNLTQHWGLSTYGNRDLIQDAWVIRDVGVFYKDDCIRVDVYYRHEDIIAGRLGTTDALSVRLTLATLGAPFYGR